MSRICCAFSTRIFHSKGEEQAEGVRIRMDSPLILSSWEHISAHLCLQAGGAAELEDVCRYAELSSPLSFMQTQRADKPQSALGMALMHWFCHAVWPELAWPAAPLHLPVLLSLQVIG